MIMGRRVWIRLAASATTSITRETSACSAGLSGSTMATCTNGSATITSSAIAISRRRMSAPRWPAAPRGRGVRARPVATPTARGSQLDDQLDREIELVVRPEVVEAEGHGNREAVVDRVLDE